QTMGILDALFKQGVGSYHRNYDPRVHGFYSPDRNYGCTDTRLLETKVKDLPAWLGRRNYNPIAICQAIGRAYWRYNLRWISPKNIGAPLLAQACFFPMFIWYVVKYDEHAAEAHSKYH
ncbi:hypothetical protein BOX15_Mlig001982g2, partial [Macrostomum lignano]